MTIDTKNLRVLAEAATPGPWTIYTDEVISPIVAAMELSKLAHGSVFTPVLPMVVGSNGLVTAVTGCGPTSVANADFIAACSPDVLLALLDALERRDAALRTCLDACKCVLEQVKCPPVEVDFAIEAITKELADGLRKAALEIAAAGHAGWGNACSAGADAIEALQARVAELEYLDTQRLSSLCQVEAERNAAQGVIETITKDQTWFELKAERDALQARVAELEDELGSSTAYTLNELQAKICGLAGERDRLAAELAAALPYGPRPKFGAIGSRDVDVAEAQRAWDKAMAAQPAQMQINCDDCVYHYKDADQKPCAMCIHGTGLYDNFEPRIPAAQEVK